MGQDHFLCRVWGRLKLPNIFTASPFKRLSLSPYHVSLGCLMTSTWWKWCSWVPYLSLKKLFSFHLRPLSIFLPPCKDVRKTTEITERWETPWSWNGPVNGQHNLWLWIHEGGHLAASLEPLGKCAMQMASARPAEELDSWTQPNWYPQSHEE